MMFYVTFWPLKMTSPCFSPCGPARSSLFALSGHLRVWQGSHVRSWRNDCIEESLGYLRQLLGVRLFSHIVKSQLSSHPTS